MKRAIKDVFFLSLMVLLIFILIGCNGQKKKVNGKEYFIYNINSEENQLVKESVYISVTNLEEVLEVLLSYMEKSPIDATYKKAKKEFIHLLDYAYAEKRLTLYFDASYLQLTGIQEVLSRAAIVKTLCQIDDVDYVEFMVEGEPLKTSKERVVGLMSESDFVDNMIGENTYRQKMNVSMYFANSEGDRLIEVPITILYDGSIPLEQMVLQQLIQGPGAVGGIDENTMTPTLPKETKLNQITVKDRIGYVDLSSDFLVNTTEVSNELMIYSIVNVLVDLPQIDKVQFLIDGNVVDYYGDIDFDVQFERNLDIVEVID